MAIVDWDRNSDLPSGRVEIVGCASINKLKADVATTQVLRKGTCIPDTHTYLQADNFGISFSDLEKDWESVIQYITTHSPPNTSNYPNPFTGLPCCNMPAMKTAKQNTDSVLGRNKTKEQKPTFRNRIIAWVRKLFSAIT